MAWIEITRPHIQLPREASWNPEFRFWCVSQSRRRLVTKLGWQCSVKQGGTLCKAWIEDGSNRAVQLGTIMPLI
jgi:hypothetical protein